MPTHPQSKRNFARKFLGKHRFHIRKIKEKKLLGPNIRWGIYGLILFFFGVVFVNLQPHSNEHLDVLSPQPASVEEKPLLTYLFYDKQGNTYDIFEHNGEHGAPQSWEYLFEGVDEEELWNTPQEEIPAIDAVPPLTGASTTGSVETGNVDSGATVPLDEPFDEPFTGTTVPLGTQFPSAQHPSLPPLPVISGSTEKIPEIQPYVPEFDWSLGIPSTGAEIIDGPLPPVDALDPETLPLIDEAVDEGVEEKAEEEEVEVVGVGKSFSFIGKLILKPRNPLPPKEKPQTGIQILPDYQDCTTPRGYTIVHGASVLAYQQDLHTPDTCKIERRFCKDGKLSGTFMQQSCATNTQYSYYQEQFVAYNTNKKSEFVQPTPLPGNTAEALEAGRDKQGAEEVIQVPNPIETSRNKGGSGVSTTTKEVEQTERPYGDCLTPRGELVKHGQFVKAYHHKNGFNDAPCEVQLRTCIVGTLEGTYEQLSCRHWDTSYIDWLNNYPTWDSGYSQEKMRWIQQIRASETHYEKEYGNTLSSAALEKILNMLDR